MPSFLRLVACLLVAAVGLAVAADDDSVHIHFFSGSKEYKSQPSLEAWKTRLEERGVTCTLFHAGDKSKVGADAFAPLAEADLMVVFCRRWKLDDEAKEALAAYLESGKPIVGIRTGSHAWNYDGFDREIMGGSYKGHGGGEEVQVLVEEDAADHPILEGIESWTRQGKLYRNNDNAEDTVTLLTGKGANDSQPLAWCREHEGRRTFYTGMGYPHDFENEHFQRLMHNALGWCLQHEHPGREAE